jgi:hypothetical protein
MTMRLPNISLQRTGVSRSSPSGCWAPSMIAFVTFGHFAANCGN